MLFRDCMWVVSLGRGGNKKEKKIQKPAAAIPLPHTSVKYLKIYSKLVSWKKYLGAPPNGSIFLTCPCVYTIFARKQKVSSKSSCFPCIFLTLICLIYTLIYNIYNMVRTKADAALRGNHHNLKNSKIYKLFFL